MGWIDIAILVGAENCVLWWSLDRSVVAFVPKDSLAVKDTVIEGRAKWIDTAILVGTESLYSVVVSETVLWWPLCPRLHSL